LKPKYGRVTRKPTKGEKVTKIFRYLGSYLYEHAFTCETQSCICRASTFNDALGELVEADKEYKIPVKEIWNRDKDVEIRPTD